MSVLDAIGFRAYTSASKRFTTLNLAVDVAALLIGSYGPGGSAGIRFPMGASGAVRTTEARKTIQQGNQATIYLEFGFKTSVLPGSGQVAVIAQLCDTGTVQCDIALNSTGNILLRRNGSTTLSTSTGVLSINTRYRIGWKLVINNSTGSSILQINELADGGFAVSGVDTQQSANASANEFVLGGAIHCVSQNIDYDNVVLSDDSFHGECTVLEDLPTGTGDDDDGVASGAADTRHAVDDTDPDDDSTFSALQAVNDKFLLTYPNLPSGVQVVASGTLTWAKKSAAGTGLFKPDLKIGGTEYLGTEFAPSNGSYAYFIDLLTESPETSSDWTESEVNAMQVGVKRTG
jgi:hypothetical protein